MVDADYRQWDLVRAGRQIHRNARFVESCVDVIYWNWIVRVCGVAGNVADHAQFAIWRGQGVAVDEWRDLSREINAVDEYI